MDRWYLQRRFGGFTISSRESSEGETIAAGSNDAVFAALRLLNTYDPTRNGWAEYSFNRANGWKKS